MCELLGMSANVPTDICFSAASCATALASEAALSRGSIGTSSIFFLAIAIITLQLGCSVCDDQHGV